MAKSKKTSAKKTSAKKKPTKVHVVSLIAVTNTGDTYSAVAEGKDGKPPTQEKITDEIGYLLENCHDMGGEVGTARIYRTDYVLDIPPMDANVEQVPASVARWNRSFVAVDKATVKRGAEKPYVGPIENDPPAKKPTKKTKR